MTDGCRAAEQTYPGNNRSMAMGNCQQPLYTHSMYRIYTMEWNDPPSSRSISLIDATFKKMWKKEINPQDRDFRLLIRFQ